jgi:hypothetical protein
MRGWLATVPAQALNVTLRNDHGSSGGEARVPWQDRENLTTHSVSYLSPAQLQSTQRSRRCCARTVSAVLADGFQATLPARRDKRSSSCRPA